MGFMTTILPAIFTLLPLIILAFVLRWIRLIKINSELQIKQNEQIIQLLEQIVSENKRVV